MYRVKGDRCLLLASSSPRRRELLESTGLRILVQPSGVDEQEIVGESPMDMVLRLALAKAFDVAGRAISGSLSTDNSGGVSPDRLFVIGADTTVSIDNQIFGKPANRAEAERMLDRLSGRTHQVFSGYAVVQGSRVLESTVIESRVEFALLSPEQVSAYVRTGEPMDKAGAYAIQGVGLHLVTRVEGCYSNIVGLSLPFVIKALLKHQIIEVAPV